MKKEELEKYEKLLLKKREELMEELKIRKTQLDETIKDATGDLSSYSYHMADQGTDAMEREKSFHFASKSGRLLYHIDEALRRLRKGEYGNCQSCGRFGLVRLNPMASMPQPLTSAANHGGSPSVFNHYRTDNASNFCRV